MIRRPPRSTLFPLHDALPISGASRSRGVRTRRPAGALRGAAPGSGVRSRVRARSLGRRGDGAAAGARDRKSTRLNSSHLVISYAVFCLKKKNKLYFLKAHIAL